MAQGRSLPELVRDGAFLAKRHARLLETEPDLPWAAFAELQHRYQAARDLADRRKVASEFERLVKVAHEEAQRQGEPVGCQCPACADGLQPNTTAHFELWGYELELDNGQPWRVETYFLEFLEDFFTGVPEAWLLVPEGNAKTTSVAGLALYHCEHLNSAWVPWAASSRDQAEIGFRQGEGFVNRTPRLKRGFRCQEGYRRIKALWNGSRIQIFAAGDDHGDGVIPTLPIIDELHRHKDLRLYRTWSGKLAKRNGQLLTISTAGDPTGEFELTRERIRHETEVVEQRPGFLRARSKRLVLHEHAVPEDGDVSDMATVKLANPFSGITEETLQEKYDTPTMTLAHWRRFTCNLATRAVNSAVTDSEWAKAQTPKQIPAGVPLWYGLDLGWKWDTTALVPLWWRDFEFRVLGDPIILVPPRNGESLHPDEVRMALMAAHERNPIEVLVMDPTHGAETSAFAQDELDALVIEHGQGNAQACDDYAAFMEALRSAWLWHTGSIELRQHVLNAVSRVLPGGGVRFDRISQTRQGGDQERRVIDALVAGASVHSARVTLERNPPRKRKHAVL